MITEFSGGDHKKVVVGESGGEVVVTCSVAKGDPAPRLVWQWQNDANLAHHGLQGIRVESDNATNEIRLAIDGSRLWHERDQPSNHAHIFYCEAHQDRIGVTKRKAFYVRRMELPYAAIAGGSVAALFFLGMAICCGVALWRMRKRGRWRKLSPDELQLVSDFFIGRAAPSPTSDPLEAETNAWCRKYDESRYECSSKDLQISKF